MTTRFSQPSEFSGSATIYQFPPRGRYALRDAGNGFITPAHFQLPRGAVLAPLGEAWYHDEAVRNDGGREH
ncbi:MAG TPA: DUF2735 domain-containing protein [Xanthobacteraceae bacterium]|jgi:hypothetical protein|nr:DUF2735 domain-containing protein [Xanthobacteraceae bacterium]